jgi:hypothetical protein
VNLLNEQADSNQQGMQSLLSGFLGGVGSAQHQSTGWRQWYWRYARHIISCRIPC